TSWIRHVWTSALWIASILRKAKTGCSTSNRMSASIAAPVSLSAQSRLFLLKKTCLTNGSRTLKLMCCGLMTKTLPEPKSARYGPNKLWGSSPPDGQERVGCHGALSPSSGLLFHRGFQHTLDGLVLASVSWCFLSRYFPTVAALCEVECVPVT